MKTFVEFLVNEVNGNSPIAKAISKVTMTVQNPMKKMMNKVKRSFGNNISNRFSKYNKRQAQMKKISSNANRIKKIRSTIVRNSSL